MSELVNFLRRCRQVKCYPTDAGCECLEARQLEAKAETVAVPREQLEWLLSRANTGHCRRCPAKDGCTAWYRDDCYISLRAHFLPEEATAMSDTVTVRRSELEWLLARASTGHCSKCPAKDSGCAAWFRDTCLSRLRAHFLPEEARDD